jgi:hypothetical protein
LSWLSAGVLVVVPVLEGVAQMLLTAQAAAAAAARRILTVYLKHPTLRELSQ